MEAEDAVQAAGGKDARIFSMGDLLLDVLVRYDPATGEADTGPEGVAIAPGGSAANFAAHAARLGAQVSFFGRVGGDWAGEMLAASLLAEGVDASIERAPGETTGRVLVMLDRHANRRMWSYPGASSALDPERLEPRRFSGLDAFHLTGYSLLRPGPRAAAVRAFEMARSSSGVLCSLDPNPAHLIHDFGPARFRGVLEQLRFDILFPNLEEGALLSGAEQPDDIAESLLQLAPTVVLTLGADGCLVATREGKFHHAPASAGKAVDVTGAGDAFAAGFMVEYVRTRNLQRAAAAANLLAAQVVARTGAR